MALTTLDFGGFSSLDLVERKVLADRMIKCFRRFGAVRLINHGISAEVLDAICQWVS